MSKQSQKEAVYNAIISVLSENGVHVSDNTDVSTLLTKEYRSQISQILFQGFRSGSIEVDRQFDDTGLRAYVSGLVSNWLRKDKRLNGGTKYTAKNPGSRLGIADTQLKAMRALLSSLSSESERAEVQSAISARLAELQASKVQHSIDLSALPTNLATKFIK